MGFVVVAAATERHTHLQWLLAGDAERLAQARFDCLLSRGRSVAVSRSLS